MLKLTTAIENILLYIVGLYSGGFGAKALFSSTFVR